MKITGTGTRPVWLKHDDLITNRVYRGEDLPFKSLKTANDGGIDWCAIVSFDIPDDHPYAVAAREGFTYHDGGPKPAGNIAKVIYRNGNILNFYPPMRWDHTTGGREFDIVGYRLASQFDPTKPVQTRNGRKARIIATDRVSEAYPIVALVTSGGIEEPRTYTSEGRLYYDSDLINDYDLLNVPITRTYGDTLANSGQGVNVTEVDGVITEVTPV